MKDESYLKLPADQQTLSGDISRLTVPIAVRGVLADKDGVYEFYALPGSYTLSLLSTMRATLGDGKSPKPQVEFELTHETDREISIHSDQTPRPFP